MAGMVGEKYRVRKLYDLLLVYGSKTLNKDDIFDINTW